MGITTIWYNMFNNPINMGEKGKMRGSLGSKECLTLEKC